MGRQKGEAARSKARPSSSSLAASLLQSGSPSAAAAAVGFGGYVGSARLDTSSFSAASTSSSNEDATLFLDVDSEAAQHLKRLGRKDPITKLKALQSLSVLFKEKSGKDLVLIVPQWTFEYKRLLLDYNREVRRATNETMANLVVAVGRDLAPHLKTLMGPWWFSQFDPVPEVSMAAKQSLQAAFPAQEKRLDALFLCTTEIFMYLEENLNLTPQNMSDKVNALDELEEMHQQVISSSLLALATLLDILIYSDSGRPGFENIAGESKRASKARMTAISFAEKLFSSQKYYLDFLKSKSPAVRSATYSVLKSSIRCIPHSFTEANMKTIASVILGAFQEKDPTCHLSMWDVLLLFSKRFPNSWAFVNVQKTVLIRFWQFLRNGCFGSQQISYPALVLFLETVPSQAVGGEMFILDFLSNLWHGRGLSHSVNADRLAFFQAFKECFLWGLNNASRYCGNSDSVKHFQVTLVDDILVKLLWHEYLFFFQSQDGFPEDPPKHGTAPLQERMVESLNIKHMSYLQELGRCIIEILSGIYFLEPDLISTFCVEFRETCLRMLQLTEETERTTENFRQVIKFLSQLEQHAVLKGENWPLLDLVGPMLAKTFPLIRSLDMPDGVELLSVAVSLFGPRKIVLEVFMRNAGDSSYSSASERDEELDQEDFMLVFKETFVPWCLLGRSSSTNNRLDILLTFLDDENFSKQWGAVLSFATNQSHSTSEPGSLALHHLDTLAMLLEKARAEISRRKVRKDSNHRQWYNAEEWHHELLESAAVAVACSPLSLPTSTAQFLCAVLGGSDEYNQITFVPRNAMVVIFKELFKKLRPFISESTSSFVKDSGYLLCSGFNDSVPETKFAPTTVEMAQFTLDVLGGSFFCLQTMVEEIELVSDILASIFILDWELSISKAEEDAFDDQSLEANNKVRMELGESVHGFRCNINYQFWKCLGIDNRKRLGSVLVHFIRSAIFKEDKLNANEITDLCCTWMIEVLACLCLDEIEEQNLLDQLLSEDDTWPLWIVPDSRIQKRLVTSNADDFSPIDTCAPGNLKFISVIDKLILKIGISKVIAGPANNDLPSIPRETTNEVASRAWVAAEILCTWKWPEGSAVASFLPLLSEAARRDNYPLQEILLDSIFKILLDGALLHGERHAQSLLNGWLAFDEKLEEIEEPFLRALLSLLVTLFKDKIWGGKKAMAIFELLVDKLFIGEAVNWNCLKILPPIMTVLTPSLPQRCDRSGESSGDSQLDASGEDMLEDTVKGWLQRVLSFPPLVTWQTGQDMEEWFQLVIACYPVHADDAKSLKLERNLSPEEITLILDIFRKQRYSSSALSSSYQRLDVRMLLSKLMLIAVGYCWKEFSEEDWEFFFSQLRSSIQSAVLIMEEMTEDVNDAISNSASKDMDVTVNNLEQIVLIPDPYPINIAVNALASYSVLFGVLGLQQPDMDNSGTVITERWGPTRDRIMEGILRLLFCTGLCEAIASSHSHEAASVVAAYRLDNPCFWELVASNVVKSPSNVLDRAVKSVEFWGLSKGPISSLYAILFSSVPMPSLQFAVYVILSTEPVSQLAIIEEGTLHSSDDNSSGDQDSFSLELSSQRNVHLSEELSGMVEKLPYDVLDMDLMAQERVNIFLAWSLLLSHIMSLQSSPTREHLVQYVRDCVNSVILDCLFQHIPSELCTTQSVKKKDAELSPGASEVASSATRAITTGSLLFSVESLWPITPDKMASFAGALVGLTLRVLPAYVREWFSNVHERSTSSLIESFTRTWCSPPLIVNELSQVKHSNFADDNFSVSVRKAANEIVATYTKEEAGMDLVIRLPASYPLRPVDVNCMRSLGISESKQGKWLMSMMKFVRDQNGALAEAIRIWKSNVDKEFEGVEECPICYSVIHTVDHSIPRLACRTCKHKFHKACLYKWFSTSHKSSCPLCQSPF